MAAELFKYGTGNKVGYCDPKALLTGPERAYPHGSLEEFSPTLMCGVPKVWETIKNGGAAKVAKGGPVVSFLFKLALRMKKHAVVNGMYTPLFDAIVFKKFKKMIGGKMKLTLSGGGAISSEVQEWVRTAFGCPLVQGYGLTETCGGATVQMPDDLTLGIAGSVISAVEVVLHSEPEITDNDGLPYMATDVNHCGTPCVGRGEVWIRGPSITSGYYKMPEKTAEDYDAEGWFHTGDIGLMTPAGQLKIVDRKKNLVKCKGGEYVALEKMNVTYNNCPLVDPDAGGVSSYADGEMDSPVCFAQIKEAELAKLAAELGVSGTTQQLCVDPKVVEAVKAALIKVAKDAKLPRLEHVAAVAVLCDPWSPDNGCLTATSKLVPKAIAKRHAKELAVAKPKGIRG